MLKQILDCYFTGKIFIHKHINYLLRLNSSKRHRSLEINLNFYKQTFRVFQNMEI